MRHEMCKLIRIADAKLSAAVKDRETRQIVVRSIERTLLSNALLVSVGMSTIGVLNGIKTEEFIN